MKLKLYCQWTITAASSQASCVFGSDGLRSRRLEFRDILTPGSSFQRAFLQDVLLEDHLLQQKHQDVCFKPVAVGRNVCVFRDFQENT